MAEAYLVEAVRTPITRRGGGLSGVHPADLGAHVLRALMRRSAIDPAAVADVIFGCVDAIGPQAGNIARTSWLAAGLPEEVPGVTVDRQCGSSQQALHFAAQAVLSGSSDLVVAGGVQNMSAIPIAAAMTAGQAYGFADPLAGSVGWRERYGDQEISQFRAAELIAEKWKIGRTEMERYALESHRRAVQAIDENRFVREIEPYRGHTAGPAAGGAQNDGAAAGDGTQAGPVGIDVDTDEGPRRDTTAERMAGLKPLTEGGRVTAALASQISDGAAAILVACERGLREHGLRPRARIHHLSVRAADPVFMLTGPIAATAYALDQAGLGIGQIDLVEINEAFAPVVLCWQRETGTDLSRVNVNGGAIALGHPLGATGARLMTTMLHELERTGGRYGLQTMCEGGGTANVTIIERL